MNLNDAKIAEFKALPPLVAPQPAVKEGEVVKEPDEVCWVCEAIDSQKLANGCCSICGSKWEEDEVEDDDFLTALDLLFRTSKLFYQLLMTPKVVKKLSYQQEMDLRELDSNIADLLGDFNEAPK